MRRLPKAIKRVSKKEFLDKILSHQEDGPIELPKRKVFSWKELEEEKIEKKVIRW